MSQPGEKPPAAPLLATVGKRVGRATRSVVDAFRRFKGAGARGKNAEDVQRLLRALHDRTSLHGDDYAALQADEMFWSLFQRISDARRSGAEAPAALERHARAEGDDAEAAVETEAPPETAADGGPKEEQQEQQEEQEEQDREEK